MTDPGMAIRCRALTRSFEHGIAVDSVTLDVPRGSVLALLGHNGAGKTTTIRLLNGILRPDAGTSEVLGLDPATDGNEVRRRTGVVTENAGLDDRLTAREHLEITARLRGATGPAIAARVDDLLERFGMSRHADQPCRGFSTGQRRRVALARALVHDPELLFLDEPTSGLDPAGARAVMELIESSARQRGRTIVLCTHFLAEAGATADLMAVLHEGRLVEFGRPDDLAARRWPGLDVDLELGAVQPAHLLGVLGAVDTVSRVVTTEVGATVTLRSRDDIPGVVATLVRAGIDVFGTTARPRGLEDVYFAIQRELVGGRGEAPVIESRLAEHAA